MGQLTELFRDRRPLSPGVQGAVQRVVVIHPLLLAGVLFTAASAAAEERMPLDRESAATKCDMLGGHLIDPVYVDRYGRRQTGAYIYRCSAPGMQAVELNHCMPLCLHGSNDRSNLQLQTWDKADRKDALGNRLCEEVRFGIKSLAEAQAEMATKWPCRKEDK